MDIIEIQEFDPKTYDFGHSTQHLRNIEWELYMKITDMREYVYLEDILRRIGFSEAAIEKYIRIHGNCRWGPNGFEREVTETITHWVKG